MGAGSSPLIAVRTLSAASFSLNAALVSFLLLVNLAITSISSITEITRSVIY